MMLFLELSKLLFPLFCLFSLSLQFAVENENEYLNSWSTLTKDSYSAYLPEELKNQCKSQPPLSQNLPIQSITNSLTSEQVQRICGTNSICTIEKGVTVTMNTNLNVAALFVKGYLSWNDQSQNSDQQWLCAGYIVIDGGEFNMKVENKKAYIYIKNNNLRHEKLSYRALGSINKGKVTIIGRTMPRTWSLLSKKIARSVNSISLIHNPEEMGWKVGDRIVMAPTDLNTAGSEGTAETFFIGGFSSGNTILLVDKNNQKATTSKIYFSEAKYVNSETFALVRAEVINLSRNILITGDDFAHVNGVPSSLPDGDAFDKQQSSECTAKPSIRRTKCTLGLHIIAYEEGSVLSLQYTRIEKCGQRGVLGKYCTHLHLVKSCPDCLIIGNAYEYGHQRGTVVHGTHLARVEQNVYNDIRGANIYVEDGNELYNKIFYNVGICPWRLSGEKHGCTIPGTDNDQADTSLNQAGIWALGFENYVIGNRFSNSFNGMLYQEQGHTDGRQTTKGKLCSNWQKIGRLEGNTFHNHGRFGSYVLADVFPKNVERNVESNGIPLNKDKDCQAWLPDGTDNGRPSSTKNNVDFRNAFVGQYSAGDIQYKNHISFSNNNNIYWKETKNFQDGCSAHFSDSFYENGNMALPGGHGTIILERVTFKNNVNFESSHHCDIGSTGALCMPVYLFSKMKWIGESPKATIEWRWNGGIFTLAPDDELNGNALFPKGYRSIIHPNWQYLLKLDNGQTCFTSDQANERSEKFKTNNVPTGAILCKKSARRLEIFSFNRNDNRNMVLELYQNGQRISSVVLKLAKNEPDVKGYSAVVITGTTHSYKLRMESGDQNVPKDWIIEFSDIVFGNRFEKDQIKLQVEGRNCKEIVDSMHDRRWIWSGTKHLVKPGRGACTENPDMPFNDCRFQQPKLTNIDNCNICKGKSCSNGYCDCGTGKCMCEAGFTGLNCEKNICSSAGCSHGVCSAKYLGGEIPVTINRCVCEDGWYGERCDSKEKPAPDLSSLMPCEERCSGDGGVWPFGCNGGLPYGYCGAKGGCSYTQNSDPNLCCFKGCDTNPTNPTNPPPTQPNQITNSCDGKCKGSYPYGCNPSLNLGYCGLNGGCSYTQNSDPNMCCFKGCDTNPTNPTNPPPTQPNQITNSCDGKCKGSYPYGCNPSFNLGYCGLNGGCTYERTNDPYWCRFKGN